MNASEASTTAVCMLTVQTTLGLTIAHVTVDSKETVGHAPMSMNVKNNPTTAVFMPTVKTALDLTIAWRI